MPARYRVTIDSKYQFGSLIKLDKDKATIKLDNGVIITDPPTPAYYVGQISDRQLKRIIAKRGL